MENVIDVYERPYDPKYPVLSFDERPCQLLDNVLTPVMPSPGKVKKIDYHYKRNGTCCVLAAIEPLTGKRIFEVRERRTKQDYKEFFEKIYVAYPEAEKITIIQDNLNTHNPSSFYENMPPKDAFKLTSSFEMVYTPKKASWLNVIEIEFSALSKQCLDRRIGDIETLRREVTTWAKQRVEDEVKIIWQFSKEKARDKFNKRYTEIRNKNVET